MKNLNIAQLVVDTKDMVFDFPGTEGFKVKLNHLSKPKQVKIREASLVSKVDAESGLPYTDLDQDLYIQNYAKEAILGWEGLTGHILATLLLMDEKAMDLDEEIDYSVENAVTLLRYSKSFDNWVTQKMSKLDDFRG